jgi:hypothetical protein
MGVDLLRLVPRSDINTVIMDYLVKEGYPDSARKFALEANIKQRPEDESIRTRVLIRNAIHSGDIQTAIEQINELNPEVGAIFLLPLLLAMIRSVPHAPLIAFGF